MEITFGAKTDVGLRREHNEDSHCADPELELYVVCDGMGGQNAGEVASRMAVEVIHKHMQDASQNGQLPMIGEFDPNFSPRTNRLASAIRLANQVIHSAGQGHPGQEGMGTTVVAAALSGQVLSVAHVGDSRLYLVRDQEIQPLTADHSLVAEQVRRGILTEEEAEQSPQKNIITRALGLEEDVEVDLDEVPVMQGDGILLCSDGLTRGVKPSEILAVMREETDPQLAASRLVEMANAAGGEDNTTVICLTVQEGTNQGVWSRFWNWFAS